jgi:formylglycine-generating enzyme required for sulfatase activity
MIRKRMTLLIFLIILLLLAGFLARFWLPPLLDFLGTNSDLIQALTDLVQLLLWAGSILLFFLGYRRSQQTLTESPEAKTNSDVEAKDPLSPLVNEVYTNRDVSVIITRSAHDLLRFTESQELSTEAVQQATEHYLHYLLDRFRYLDMKGMGVSNRVPLRLPLLDLYVPLRARLTLPEGETWQRNLRLAGRHHSKEEQLALTGRLGKPQPVLDLLRQHDGLIILGDPGAGKTTFLKVLALRLALGEGEAMGLGHRLPVVVPLSGYAAALAEGDVRLDNFIADHFHDIGADLPIAKMLRHAFESGRALILLDGLDEVKDLAERHTVVERVIDFYILHRRQGNKFVLTSRVVGYRQVRPTAIGLAECTLIDFEDDEINAFVTRWTQALEQQASGESAVSHDKAERERQDLLDAIRRNPGVRRLAANPLLLTILALMKRQGVRLPERRVELYNQYVQTMLSSWNRARGLGRPPTHDLDVVQTVRILAPLALWMHERNPGMGLVKREALRRYLESILETQGVEDPGVAARQFLSDVREYTGLLLERGLGQYGFIHLTFEEYLAAMAIALLGQGECQPIVNYLSPYINDSAWREIAVLTVSYLGIIQQLDRVAGEVVEALVNDQPGEPGAVVVLAGQAVLDAGKAGVLPRSRRKIIEALIETMQDAAVEVSLRRKAGLILGDLDWEPDDLDTFVELSPGTFLYGDGEEEREFMHRYWIGKYPVTNAQYARFVEADGYEQETYWSVEGWTWRTGNYTSEELNHLSDEKRDMLSQRPPDRRNCPFHWKNRKWNNAIFPVVGVSWFEAEAYCNWLTEHLALADSKVTVWRDGQLVTIRLKPGTFDIRLPFEEEWERAVRGIDGSVYPWGNSPDWTRLNCAEAWAGREFEDEDDFQDTIVDTLDAVATTSVITYPRGKNAVGILDGAGNIWEWTASWWDKGNMVLRGGSWYDMQELSRCASRIKYDPGYFHLDGGFRVLISLSSLER